MSTKICPICGSIAESLSDGQFRSGIFCSCKVCGRYEIDPYLYTGTTNRIEIEEKLRSSMYYFLTQIRKEQRKEDTRNIRFDPRKIDGKEISDERTSIFVSQDALLNIYPVDYDDKISMILVNFSNLCARPGELFFEGSMTHLFFLNEGSHDEKVKEMNWWLETLTDSGYIQNKSFSYTLTLIGWKRAKDYAKALETSKTAFVAMSFADELLPARAEIVKAIESSGFVPMVIDTKEHNNQILPEILHEIRKSRFVVVDLTKQRNGVYYEAGYAEGLNIPVIALCRKDDFDNVHFDLKQKNTIRWETPEGITERLVKRIKATLDLN